MPDRARPGTGRLIVLASALLGVLGASLAGPVGIAAAPVPTAAPAANLPAALPGEVPGYRLPFAVGLDVRIEQGWNSAYSHNGEAAYAYDFGLHEGTPVLAAARGVVSYVHAGETACGGADLLRNANYVTIDHADGTSTQYGHLATVEVKVGDAVEQGQRVGLSGKTGYSGCQPHLHFARQATGGPVTQSMPIYFDGYPDQAFVDGEIITSPEACPRGGAALPSLGGAQRWALSATTTALCGAVGATIDGDATMTRAGNAIEIDHASIERGRFWLDGRMDAAPESWSAQLSVAGASDLLITATGRIRLWIDDLLVLDVATERGVLDPVTVDRRLAAGTHSIAVEHLATTGRDVLQMRWSPTTAPG